MAGYRGPDKTEQWAFEVVRRVTALHVEFKDDGHIEGEVDAHIIGERGPEALEVTTIADPPALEAELSTQARCLEGLSDLAWRWDVRPAPGISFKRLNVHGETLIRACERDGITDPESLIPATDAEAAAIVWLETVAVDFWAFPDARCPGVDVLPGASGGAVFEDTDTLPAWIEAALSEESPAKRVRKLQRHHLSGRHLFLMVHDSGMPVSLFHAVAFGDTVPTAPLELPDGLTDLWLATRWRSGGVRRYNRAVGWSVHHPFD